MIVDLNIVDVDHIVGLADRIVHLCHSQCNAPTQSNPNRRQHQQSPLLSPLARYWLTVLEVATSQSRWK